VSITREVPTGRRIIDAGSSLFGFVLEFDDGIIVLGSDGKTYARNEEPVRWRVFPDSLHYQNHLHVVMDDYIDIMSFNHDYLVEQSSKVAWCNAYERDGALYG